INRLGMSAEYAFGMARPPDESMPPDSPIYRSLGILRFYSARTCSSFMAFIARNQPVTNPDTSADGGLPALVSDQKFALNFQAHVWGYPPGYEARWMTLRPRHSAPTGPSSGTLNDLRQFR